MASGSGDNPRLLVGQQLISFRTNFVNAQEIRHNNTLEQFK